MIQVMDRWTFIRAVAAGISAASLPRARKPRLPSAALISYAHTHEEEYQRNAAFIDRILRGAKPADLPIEQPTKFELRVNLKAAKALGITVSQTLLLRADEVIQ
jgi:putative ABC transport system substrate-binding protein